MKIRDSHPRVVCADVDQVVAEIERMFREGRLEEALAIIRHRLLSMKTTNENRVRQVAEMTRKLSGRRSEKREEEGSPWFEFMKDLQTRGGQEAHSPQVQALFEEFQKKPRDPPKPEAMSPHEHHRIPGNLPREYVRKEVPEEERVCEECKTPMKKVGTLLTTYLEYVPGHIQRVVAQRDR